MKALLVQNDRLPATVELGEALKPTPHSDEILVRVKACGVNRADLLQRDGKYPPPTGASNLLGLEVSGTIEALGTSVNQEAQHQWKIGDRVFGLLPGGGYAQFAVLHHSLAIPTPDNLSDVEAAAIPEAFLTAYQALFWLGEAKSGECLLLHAAASGVGTAILQLARLRQIKTIAICSPEKQAFCEKLGAFLCLPRQAPHFSEAVLQATEKQGVHIIIDFSAGSTFAENLKCVALDSTLVMLGSLGGTKAGDVDLRNILLKRLTIKGSTLRSRPIEYQARLCRDFLHNFLPHFCDGTLKPIIDSCYPWEDVQQAHERMEQNANIGKLVLQIS